ncbi:MAG TPA: hypothetical protein EYH06_13645 [Chromatiales bacterium]|nr:hypothetical protein [Chromatiales bacterium]
MKLTAIKISMFLVLSVLLVTLLEAGEKTPQTTATPYQIVDGKVDQKTYIGWRVFHSACHGCHGEDATGTSVAPNLVERISDMQAKDFVETVLERYRIVMPSAEMRGDDSTALRQAFVEQVLKHERGELVMPTWRMDPNVKPHVMDIYGYLKARADGALGTGRPERIEK